MEDVVNNLIQTIIRMNIWKFEVCILLHLSMTFVDMFVFLHYHELILCYSFPPNYAKYNSLYLWVRFSSAMANILWIRLFLYSEESRIFVSVRCYSSNYTISIFGHWLWWIKVRCVIISNKPVEIKFWKLKKNYDKKFMRNRWPNAIRL